MVLPTGRQRSGAWIDDTLAERVRERGLEAKLPLAGDFPRQRVEVVRGADTFAVINDLFYRRGWTDGLPIVPPTTGRVEAMIRHAPAPASHVVGVLDPLKGEASMEKIAANAVMAGCRPDYLPVVVAAVEAILEPAFNLRGVQTTDENVTPLVVVSGPVAEALDINGGFGALGPGWRANATIGRALRLVMNNIGGGWPMVVSFAGIAQPGRYTLCLAENTAASPWPALHVEEGFDASASTVTLARAECAITVTGGLAELASVMGSAASAFSVLHGGRVAVILAPAVAQELAAEGWSKDDVKRHLHEQGRIATTAWKQSWLYERMIEPERWPDWVRNAADSGAIPAVRAPDDITVVVAGGDIPIPQNVYFPSWGFPPCRVTKEIRLTPGWEAQ
ncbi:MAG: hypothetical protein QF926_11550 [Alphaproteobacteria bacterium]|nr:hypothetical protein [Alphaproteobacteria bacterium]